jgi:hypothetical protein
MSTGASRSSSLHASVQLPIRRGSLRSGYTGWSPHSSEGGPPRRVEVRPGIRIELELEVGSSSASKFEFESRTPEHPNT